MQNVCPQISELDLRSNMLTSLPEELAELKTIKNVKLNYNKFSSFPPVLASLPRLLVRAPPCALPPPLCWREEPRTERMDGCVCVCAESGDERQPADNAGRQYRKDARGERD